MLALPKPRAEIRPMMRFVDAALGGLTGAPMWLWMPPQTWRSLEQRTEAGAVWAEVTARPVARHGTSATGHRR
jgi:hypothetical protein